MKKEKDCAGGRKKKKQKNQETLFSERNEAQKDSY